MKAEVLKDKKGFTLEDLRRIEKVRKRYVQWRRRQYDTAEYGNPEDLAGARLADAEQSLADVQERIAKLEGE